MVDPAYGPAYDEGFRAGYAGERTLDQALPATLDTDERSQFWRGYHAGVDCRHDDGELDSLPRLGFTVDQQEHHPRQRGTTMNISDYDRAILGLSSDDWNGQGRSYVDETEASMRALVIVLGTCALAALGAITFVAWALLSR